jgi:Fic family protein
MQVYDLVSDPTFATLATEAVLDYLDWDDLTKRPLPPGLSADQTWRLLTAVRRFGAIRFPIRDLEGREYWYTLTREARLCLEAIERYCRADSSAHRAILHRHGQRLLVDTNIRETVALCQLDGVEVDADACREMILSGRVPTGSTERLVSNVHALISSPNEWEGEKLTPQLLVQLYRRLIDGVVRDDLRMHAPRHGLVERVEHAPVSREVLDDVIARYCDYANDKTGDPSEPVALKAHALLNTTHFWSFLPDFNGIMGRLVFKLYTTSREYPVLGYLPVASLYKSWVDRAGVPSFVRFYTLDIPRTMTDTYVDYTPDVLTYLQLTVAALDQMLGAIENGRKRDAQVRASLENDPELNYRQRAVIDRALAHPDRVFRIREHQTTHSVVYATARADLLDLADRGYLVQGTNGKAFVFHPAPDLPQRLGRTGG